MACKSGPGATHHLACACREEMLANEITRWRAEALAARNVLHWYRASNTPSVDAEARYASARAANGEE